jgi:hypothetical protein
VGAMIGVFAAGGGVATDFRGDGEAATSPALAFRDAGAPVVGRRVGCLDRATSVAGARSRADCSTHPSRETRTQPAGAFPALTDTDVPASSEAMLRPAAAPRDRSTAARLPTRGDEPRRSAESRTRSTNPSIDTFAYAPRVSSTRSARPGCTLPIARPLGDPSTADGVLTTRVCARDVAEIVTASTAVAAIWRAIRDIGVGGRIAGWSMCARIHSTGTGDRRARRAQIFRQT